MDITKITTAAYNTSLRGITAPPPAREGSEGNDKIRKCRYNKLRNFCLLLSFALLSYNVYPQTILNFSLNQPPALTTNAGTVAAICPDDSTTIGGSPTASDGTSPYTYAWSPPTGLTNPAIANPAAFPNSSTLYTVIVTDNNGCQDTSAVMVTVNSQPAASFGYSASNLTIFFSDSSTNAISWLWDFGDGNTSTSQNPIYTYFTEGTYNVCLSVTAASGCKDSTCKLVDAAVTGVNELHASNLKFQIYPNPFSNKTDIKYTLKQTADVSLEVLNLLGEKIKTLVNKRQSAGEYKFTFSAKRSGHAEGVYIVKLKLNNRIYIQKLMETQ